MSRKTADADVRFWLQADIVPPEIDFRLTPKSGHSEVYAELPLVTRNGHRPDIDTIYQMHSRVTKIK